MEFSLGFIPSFTRTWLSDSFGFFSVGPLPPGRGTSGDAQLTNRLMRTFIASPSAINTNNVEDPP
jgi:hypothetical protein